MTDDGLRADGAGEFEDDLGDMADPDSGARDGVPDDAIASASDFAHERGTDDELLPVAQAVPGTTSECPSCGGRGFETPTDDDGEATLTPPGDEFEPDPCETCDGRGETPRYIRVRPITQAEANEYLPDSGDPRSLGDDEILELVHEFVVEPDFSHVESVDDFLAFGVDPLLFAVMQASGFDMAKGMLTENSDLAGVIEGNSPSGN